MSKGRLLKDLSSNTIQTGVTQLAALIIFYVISRFISKDDFGAYNWSAAVGSTVIAIASFGLDLVLVKRIAAGKDVSIMAGIHFFHTLFTGFVLVLLLAGLQLAWPAFLAYHPLFFFVFLQLTIANVANSFKFSLTGLEAFHQLAIISVCINMLKLLAILCLFLLHLFTIRYIVIGFIGVSAIELVLSYYYVNRRLAQRVKPLFLAMEYKSFIYESLPQLGVVLFDSALARVDWILLGIMSTSGITAEYSFAYKFFELSKLPLLILAPVLLTRLTRLYHRDETPGTDTGNTMTQLFRLEMFIALLIPVFMICAWTPLIDYITDHKYGAVNQVTFSILAFCIPLHYVINFLWTLGFVQGQLKLIMYITIGVSLFNMLANMLLIPRYGSTGAALAFLAGTLIQFTAYLFLIRQDRIQVRLKPFLLALGNGIAAVLLARYTPIPVIAAAFLATGIYLVLALVSGLISVSLIRNFTQK